MKYIRKYLSGEILLARECSWFLLIFQVQNNIIGTRMKRIKFKIKISIIKVKLYLKMKNPVGLNQYACSLND
jgi:hypothetical protein